MSFLLAFNFPNYQLNLGFLLGHENEFGFNLNLLETNIFNIFILLGILIYAYQVSFKQTLETRQKEIFQTVENAQKEVTLATQSYELAEKSLTQTFFWFQSWKNFYEKEKIELTNQKYTQIQNQLEASLALTETIISTFEKKAFSDLQRLILLLTTSQILRKFFLLSEEEQTRLIDTNLSILMKRRKL